MPLSASVFAAVTARLSGAPDLGTTQYELDVAAKFRDFAAGVAAGQVSKAFVDTRTLALSTGEDLDLSGALLDPLGGAAVFTVVKVIFVKAAAANTNNVVIGNAAANGFIGPFGAAAHTIAIPPGGCVMLVHPGAGWPVTAATADLLHILNGGAGTSVTYDIVILG
jgi:hypothetical protein